MGAPDFIVQWVALWSLVLCLIVGRRVLARFGVNA